MSTSPSPPTDPSPSAQNSRRAEAFRGSIVALPTPFKGGGLDLKGVDTLAQFQARSGTAGISVGGTAGEGWSLNLDETAQLVSRAVEGAAHHSRFAMRVLFAITEVDSRRAAQLAEHAALAGAEGLVISAPAHVRVDTQGLLRHLGGIVERLPHHVPIALMNEPKRTGTDISPDMAASIALEFPSVVAHCEGVGFPGRSRLLREKLDLAILTSDDRMIGPYVRSGAIGAITTVGNLVPVEVRELMVAIATDAPDADRRERSLAPLIDSLRLASSPIVPKEALAVLGAIGPELRPPLAPLGAVERTQLQRALEAAKLLVPAPR